MILSSTVVIVVIITILALAFILKTLTRAGARLQPVDPANRRLISRYAPMQRLLEETEYRFLADHPGFGKKRARKVRAQRRHIFRGYLRCLNNDYARVCASIRLVMVQSGIDRPDLAKALLKNRAIFTAALVAIEFRLAFHACGWGTVDVRGMVAALEAMRQQLDGLVSGGIGLQPALGSI